MIKRPIEQSCVARAAISNATVPVETNMLKRVVGFTDDSSGEQANFKWSCRPVLIALNLVGIPLQMQETDARHIWIVYVFGWILYFCNVATCLMITFLARPAHSDSNRSTAWQWNSGISHYNSICSILATHTVFLATTAVRWKSLVRALNRMEKSDNFSAEEFKKFRAIFLTGLFFIVLGGLAILSLSLFALFNGLTIWQTLLYSFHRCMVVYLYFAVIVFSCFGWMASTMLQMIGREMDSLVPAKETQLMELLISKWNRHYLLIIDFVHQFNRCFGCMLLALVAPAFVRVINTSFYLMMGIKSGQWTINTTFSLMMLFAHLVGFVLVANIPHRIRQEAINLTRKLRRLQLEDFNLQNKVNVLMMEISNSLPNISAAGFFDVDLQLIPTLVGTTLTYLIILFQFQTSEKH